MQKSSYYVDIDFWIVFYIEVDPKFDSKVNVDLITRLLYGILYHIRQQYPVKTVTNFECRHLFCGYTATVQWSNELVYMYPFLQLLSLEFWKFWISSWSTLICCKMYLVPVPSTDNFHLSGADFYDCSRTDTVINACIYCICFHSKPGDLCSSL